MKIEESKKLQFLEKMIFIRQFEYKIIDFARTGKIYGSVHLCVGEEACAVGTGFAFKKEDYILPTHRGHGQAIARGTDPKKLLAEISAKETGLCKGRVGSMHFFDKENNIVGCQGILGAQFPIAVGVGLAINLRKEDSIAACYFGDGTSNQGLFYEGMNFASIWDLPILFICLNNLYGMGTHYKKTCKIDIYEKAKLFGIKTDTADGNDVEEVYEKTLKLSEYIRKNKKPGLIELYTYRWLGHSALDSRPYRPKEEVEEWIKKDPIKRYEEKLLKEGIPVEEIDAVKASVEKQIEETAKFAEESPFPEFTKDMEI
ncbi:MAG: thiamine pyrophosphate-dependent dehydrogenase E1 component subunit alpha [Actinobacteria bacterium]|nr:thiamine pyrophosphate-dependent dehydrogenase E1 component subunit alpha [Cyanobacteriota bacterium]MCL5771921.1 thiamine pyrophosphate-dependent dehydrogenase E1 component subunit alpha [Actinomycetota bacterium]